MQAFNPKTIDELIAAAVTKGDVFKDLGMTYDYAVPQPWLDAFADWCKYCPMTNITRVTYSLILSTTVWVYPPIGKGQCGPMTCCSEVLWAWNAYMRDEALELSGQGSEMLCPSFAQLEKEYPNPDE